MRPRPRPAAVRVCFGAAALCLVVAALLTAWDTFAHA